MEISRKVSSPVITNYNFKKFRKANLPYMRVYRSDNVNEYVGNGRVEKIEFKDERADLEALKVVINKGF